MSEEAQRALYAIEQARSAYNKASSDAARERIVETILERAREVEHEHPVSADMAEFFMNVADGVVSAQARLEGASADYLASRARNEHTHALPASYRIARAHADFNFQFSEIEESRVGLLFHRSEHSARQTVEHRISFEVVAVPPTPEVLADLVGQPLTFSFDDDPELDERIRKAIQAAIREQNDIIDEGGDDATAAEVRRDKLQFALQLGKDLLQSRRPGGHVLWAVDDPAKPKTLFMIRAHTDQTPVRLEVSDEAMHRERVALGLRPFFEEVLGHFVQDVPTATEADRKRVVKDVAQRAKAARAVIYQDGEEREQAINALLEAVERLADLFPGLRPRSDISEFFDGIAGAVIEAQKGLDRRSRDYLASGPFLPTTFRIPSVSARFSFAVESARKRRVNAILYGSEQQERRQREQSVGFELIAAPLDPAQLSTPRGEDQIAFTLIVSESERERVRATIRRAPNPGKRVDELLGDETWSRAKILHRGQRYFVFAPAKERADLMITAYLERGLDHEHVKTFDSASRFPASYRWFFDWWWPELGS